MTPAVQSALDREAHRQRSCVGKQRFASEAAAAMHIKPKSSRKEHVPRGSYHCKYCRFWHLTSRKKK